MLIVRRSSWRSQEFTGWIKCFRMFFFDFCPWKSDLYTEKMTSIWWAECKLTKLIRLSGPQANKHGLSCRLLLDILDHGEFLLFSWSIESLWRVIASTTHWSAIIDGDLFEEVFRRCCFFKSSSSHLLQTRRNSLNIPEDQKGSSWKNVCSSLHILDQIKKILLHLKENTSLWPCTFSAKREKTRLVEPWPVTHGRCEGNFCAQSSRRKMRIARSVSWLRGEIGNGKRTYCYIIYLTVSFCVQINYDYISSISTWFLNRGRVKKGTGST